MCKSIEKTFFTLPIWAPYLPPRTQRLLSRPQTDDTTCNCKFATMQDPTLEGSNLTVRGCLVDVAVVRFTPLDELPPPTPNLHPPVILDF